MYGNLSNNEIVVTATKYLALFRHIIKRLSMATIDIILKALICIPTNIDKKLYTKKQQDVSLAEMRQKLLITLYKINHNRIS